jgi:hypothetical protein
MDMGQHRLVCALPLAVVLGLGTLSIAPMRGAWATTAAMTQPPINVLVTNDGALDVVVFAYRNGLRLRVGMVAAHSRGMVTVPAGMTAPGRVRLLLHSLAGEDFLVDELAIRPDEEHAELHVTAQLDESFAIAVGGRSVGTGIGLASRQE